MNFTNKFNGNLNEISNEQVVLSHKDIYRKINNLENSYDIFFLSLKDNNFIWEKYSSKIIPYGIVENINILSALIDKNSNLILFKTNGFKIVTHKMEMNTEGNFGFWENVTSETNSYLMNQYILSKSLKDIPTHIDLTKEYICQKDTYDSYDPYDIINDYEPLKGWEHFDINSDNIPSDIEINDDNISSNIEINNDPDRALKAQTGGKLLQTLASNNLFLSSACGGKGTCSQCKCKVIEGGGSILPTEESYFTNKEKTSNNSNTKIFEIF